MILQTLFFSFLGLILVLHFLRHECVQGEYSSTGGVHEKSMMHAQFRDTTEYLGGECLKLLGQRSLQGVLFLISLFLVLIHWNTRKIATRKWNLGILISCYRPVKQSNHAQFYEKMTGTSLLLIAADTAYSAKKHAMHDRIIRFAVQLSNSVPPRLSLTDHDSQIYSAQYLCLWGFENFLQLRHAR